MPAIELDMMIAFVNRADKLHSIAVELETTAHEETPQTITLKLQKAVMELEELAKVLRGKVAVKT